MSRRNRLGELPRACSQLTDYPSRLSKTADDRRSRRQKLRRETPESPSMREEGSGHATPDMELMGIEPTTSGLQNRRSPS